MFTVRFDHFRGKNQVFDILQNLFRKYFPAFWRWSHLNISFQTQAMAYFLQLDFLAHPVYLIKMEMTSIKTKFTGILNFCDKCKLVA